MNIKYYEVTEPEVLKHLYSLSYDQQMVLAINYTFGAQQLGIKVADYILRLISDGRFTYRGIPVRLKEPTV